MEFIENENFKVLIVDDTPKNIQVLGSMLRDEKYDIYFANSGRAALIQIEHSDFDLILLDIMMPEMDGYEVCSMLKGDDRTKDIPVIFLTARNDNESVIEGFKRGAQDYVTKPFEASELLMRVKTQITLKVARDKLKEANSKMKAELDFAKTIHSKIVTFNTPVMKNFYIKADNISVGGIGGDFIECLKLDNGNTGIAFVDVSGHGISAALMVSALKFIIGSNFKGIDKPSEALYYLNNMINNTFIGDGITLSAIYFIIDDESGKIILSSCSQEDAILMKRDGIYPLTAKGIILGILDNESIKESKDINFKDIEINMEKGEKLFFYTDGLVETKYLNRDGLNSILNSLKSDDTDYIFEYINKEMKEQIEHEEKDDSTYMIVERK